MLQKERAGMNAIPFDTLKLARKLEASGFTRDQAAGAAEAFSEAMVQELATKGDLFQETTAIRSELEKEATAIRSEVRVEAAAIRYLFGVMSWR